MKRKNPPIDFTGLWVYECPTGLIYETEYVHGVEHGAYRHKLVSGVCLREGFKKNGLDHGDVTVRDSEGNLLSSYYFENGTGTHYIYNTSGAIGWEIPYLGGKPHGIKRHYINGKVVSEQEYCHGQKI
jgi:antitoxin component YwqK of YwqJK toxin-antitoxin module